MSNKQYILARDPSFPDLGTQAQLQFVYTPLSQTGDSQPLRARLLYITTAKYGQDWYSNPHTHAFSELFYVTGGEGRFAAGNRSYPLRKDDLVIINPHIAHTEFSSDDDPLEYIVLGIEGLQFSESGLVPLDHPGVYIINAYRQVSAYIQLLLEEIQQERLGNDAVCQNLLNIILILILRHGEIDISITPSRNVSMECASIRTYIDNHFKESVTLDTLAGVVHQNKYYIAHAFKDAYGLSPIKYLMQKRVEESCYLLATTDSPIAEIAAMTGFSSASHFSQAFRRIAGTTPNEYRRDIQQEKE